MRGTKKSASRANPSGKPKAAASRRVAKTSPKSARAAETSTRRAVARPATKRSASKAAAKKRVPANVAKKRGSAKRTAKRVSAKPAKKSASPKTTAKRVVAKETATQKTVAKAAIAPSAKSGASRRPSRVPSARRARPIPKPIHPSAAAIADALDALSDDFVVLSNKTDPPKDALIGYAERDLGRRLPSDFRAVVAYWGGFVVEASESVWARPKARETRPAWQMDYARMLFGVGRRLPLMFRITTQAQAFAARTNDTFLPAFRRIAGNGDVFGFDANDVFVRFDHATHTLTPAGDFTTVLLAEIEALRRDRERLRVEPIRAVRTSP